MSSEKNGARRRRHADPEETRRALLEAGARVFNTVGYQETDTNKIAREAGYSPGTFYRHFEDKRALFLAVHERWLDEEWAEVERQGLAPDERPAHLDAILDALVAHHRRFRVFRANLRMLVLSDETVRRRVLELRRVQMERVARTRAAMGVATKGAAFDVAQLLAIERLCDAVADGEFEALGIASSEAHRAIGTLFRDYLEPRGTGAGKR